MINAYKIKYIPATSVRGAEFKVTRIDDKKSYTVSYNYEANNVLKHAIHEAFGEDVSRIEFIGELNSTGSERLYAVYH